MNQYTRFQNSMCNLVLVTVLVFVASFSGCGGEAPEIFSPESQPGVETSNAQVNKLGRKLRVKPDGSGEYATIQDAIDAASDGDVILLAHGEFRGSGNRDLDYLGKSITIRSQGNNPSRCVIDCQGSREDPHRAANFVNGEGPDARLEGVTITGGFVVGDAPEGLGGAIFCRGSAPTLENLVISGNTAHNGGGIACRDGASPTIHGCRFLDNNATTYFDGDGGGLHCSVDSSPMVNDCVFANNAAASWGGGVFCLFSSSPGLYNCTFYGNSANYGGAVGADRGASSPMVVNSIIAFNAGGGAVRCQLGAVVLISCSDVFANVGGDFTGCIAGLKGVDGNFSADPQFRNAEEYEFSLDRSSPCLTRHRENVCGPIGSGGIRPFDRLRRIQMSGATARSGVSPRS